MARDFKIRPTINASPVVSEDKVDAKGDILAATAADTLARKAVGANDTILMADSAQGDGLKWAAVATTSELVDVDDAAEDAGTSDTYARGDHKHAFRADICLVTFSKSGVLVVGTGTLRFYVKGSWTITQVRASVNTAPTGASLIVDVNKNGTTVFTTQSNRPTIAASGFTDLADAINVTALADADYVQMDIDQIGSTIAGSDLTVQVWAERA